MNQGVFMENKIILKIKYIPSFLYSFLEVWLNKMSKTGLQLTHYKGFIYYFQKSEPSDRIYFVYNHTGYRNDEGKYSLSLRYPCIEKQYALSSHYSKINKSNKKQNNWKKIVKIDSNKIDADFNDIVNERNRIYLKRFLRNTAIFLVTVAVLIWALI